MSRGARPPRPRFQAHRVCVSASLEDPLLLDIPFPRLLLDQFVGLAASGCGVDMGLDLARACRADPAEADRHLAAGYRNLPELAGRSFDVLETPHARRRARICGR